MINLLLAIHSHQPVGNFGVVFQEAYEKAYLPFIEALERHPKIKISLHYSGSLLDWLSRKQPEFIKRVEMLVRNSQVEIISGGYYEPILALIPQDDAIGQIKMLKDRIRELFSYNARGFWMTERIWEPKLPETLSIAGIDFTIIDDSHFKMIGKDPDKLNGFYITEEQGYKLFIFPGSEKLRYYIPFKLPEETINYLRSIDSQRETTISYGDDGEKFGLWPGTYKWVYKEGWLENFFKKLEENDSWINTMTFSEYVQAHKPTDRVYLTCACYREMMEWSGGFYRNFLIKYPESNNMHKNMLYISNKIKELEITRSQKKLEGFEFKDKEILKARQELYKGQANDAYWHGVFGGLYLNHLRSAVYHHLIEAEKAADSLLYKGSYTKGEFFDFDCDGKEEIIVNTKNQKLILRPYDGGTLSFWGIKDKSINLINTLRRRWEPYHEKLKNPITNNNADGEQPKSIHDISVTKEAGLKDALFYDRYPRYCLLDYFLKPKTSLPEFTNEQYQEISNFVNMAYSSQINQKKTTIEISLSCIGELDGCSAKLTKKLNVKDKGLAIDYTLDNLQQNKKINVLFGVEFNLSVYEPSLDAPGQMEDINKLELHDVWNKLKMTYGFNRPMNVWHYPVETVSDSESGIEKTYQQLCLFIWSILEIDPKESWNNSFEVKID